MATTDQLRKAEARCAVNQWSRAQYTDVLRDAGFTALSSRSRQELFGLVCGAGLLPEVERRFTWQNDPRFAHKEKNN